MSDPLYDEINVRLDALKKFSERFVPTKLSLEPTAEQVEGVIDDLDALWSVVDPLVKAIADHAAAKTGYDIDPKLSTDQLRGALEGQLTFEIKEAADEIREAAWEAA